MPASHQDGGDSVGLARGGVSEWNLLPGAGLWGSHPGLRGQHGAKPAYVFSDGMRDF